MVWISATNDEDDEKCRSTGLKLTMTGIAKNSVLFLIQIRDSSSERKTKIIYFRLMNFIQR